MSKISELSDGGSLQSTDYLIAVRSGGNVKVQADGNLTLGTVTADALTVESGGTNIGIVTKSTDQFAFIGFEDNTSSASSVYIGADGNDFIARANSLTRFRAASNGDISFYEDTGTTPSFFWDASAESLGIGTTSPGATLDISDAFAAVNLESSTGTNQVQVKVANTGGAAFFGRENSAGSWFGTGEAYATTLRSDGAYPMVFRVNGGNRLTIDDGGNVGIGTTSPSSYPVASDLVIDTGTNGGITIKSGTTNYGGLFFADGTTGNEQYRGFVQYNHNYVGSVDALLFGTSGAERMRIDSSGNLLVGKTSAAGLSVNGVENRADGTVLASVDGGTALYLNRDTSDGELINFRKGNITVGSIGNDSTALTIGSGSTGVKFGTSAVWATTGGSTNANGTKDLGASTVRWKDLYLSGDIALNNDSKLYFASTACAIEGTSSGADYIKFTTNNSEAMRIDSSGNLLVGTTNTTHYATSTTSGHTLFANGVSTHSAAGGTVGIFNRRTNDGAILEFRKDGTQVGTIGSHLGAYLYIASANNVSGIGFYNNSVRPVDSNGSASDADQDLGASTIRWKDLYLSGGVYLGGTGAANLLDDYETGTFTPSMGGVSGWGAATGTYTKIGNTVHAFIVLTSNSGVTGTATNVISGLPFSSDLTERTSNVSVARMFGVALTTTDYIAGIIGTDIIFSYVNGDNNVNNFTTSGSTLRISLAITYTTAA